jgi:uncharacterized membrane protein YdfJ with MMPL/SSD domain
VFPSRDAALLQVRLRPGLDDEQRARAIALVRAVVAMADWRLTEGGGRYVVTGAPVVAAEVAGALASELLVLLVAALVVMALTLLLVFRAGGRCCRSAWRSRRRRSPSAGCRWPARR